MIHFRFQKAFTLKNRIKLKIFLTLLLKQEGFSVGDIDIVFCSDEFLLEINKDFLSHDYFTDIITFGESDSEQVISGELYISVDRVKENATTFKTSIDHELHRVIFHGLLHLCGYGDKSKKEIAIMRQKEEQYLSNYF